MGFSLRWLLAAAPVAIALDHFAAPAAVTFACAGLALVPLAALIVEATEHLAARLGPGIGGLLNATFGNLPELIIALAALRAGLTEMVRAAMIGAVLGNQLLALGVAFVLGGRRRHVQSFNPEGARSYAGIMLLAALSLVGPASFNQFLSDSPSGEAAQLDTYVAGVLLVLYGFYLLFTLRTHPDFFRSKGHGHHETHAAGWSMARSLGTLVAASIGAAWMAEVVVGAAEETGHALGMSPLFMGIVPLAVLGGAAEIGAVVATGRKNEMDLCVGIAMSSSIQIALFVTPLLVLLSPLLGDERLSLAFSRAEIGALLFAVLIGAILAGDGRANWFKGAQLVGFYAILGALFYLLPQ